MFGGIVAISAVVAASFAGLSVPESVGGQLGGAGARGAFGITANPASSITLDTNVDFLADFGIMIAGPTYQRDGIDPNTKEPYPATGYRGPAPNGSAAATTRATDWLGFGLTLYFPYGRGGAYPENGPQRYHTVASSFRNTRVTGSAAVRLFSQLALGAGITYVRTDLAGRSSVDLGPTVASLVGDDDPLLEDPFLEGEVTFTNGRADNVSWIVGAQYTPNDQVTIGVSFQPQVDLVVRGDSHTIVSKALALQATGKFAYRISTPAVAQAGLRWRATPTLELGAEVAWFGYAAALSESTIEITDAEVSGSNTEASALLFALGLDAMGPLLEHTKTAERGARDTWSLRALSAVNVHRNVRLHFHIGYDQHALPDKLLSPGNLDFSATFGGFALEVALPAGFSMFATTTQYFPRPRVVTNSVLDPTLPAESGRNVPSGNGVYEVYLHRTAFGLRFSY